LGLNTINPSILRYLEIRELDIAVDANWFIYPGLYLLLYWTSPD